MLIDDENISVILAYSVPDSPNIGLDIGTLAGKQSQNVKIKSVNDLDKDISKETPDIFIDFTVAKATEKNAVIILEKAIPMIIGTTGLSEKFIEFVNRISVEKKIPLVISSNMAVGVNVIFEFAAELAKKLKGWEIEIIETHHGRKLDSPSGTAVKILENIIKARKLPIDTVPKYGRGRGRNPRVRGETEIGVHAIRAGDIVGDHVILYTGNGERIELKHQAHSRDCFAAGVLIAVKFLINNKNNPKIYDMGDILGLKLKS
jgi:4-hydroxy-tetrahydrodipicolinate reductase